MWSVLSLTVNLQYELFSVSYHLCLYSYETPLQVFGKLMLFTLLMFVIPFSTYFGSKHYIFEGESSLEKR